MRASRVFASLGLAAAVCIFGSTAALAEAPPTCADQGMWTWVFASGTGGGGPAACEAAWTSFAEDIAASASYSISFGTTTTPWGDCVLSYACTACRHHVADPVVYAPAPVSPGDAGDIAVGVADGVVYRIERTDGEQGDITYTVDVLGADGLVQVLVDGKRGQASRVEGAGTASCQAGGR